MAGEATGTKKQCDQLRATLRDQGCTCEQIAAEMGRQFGFRARQAWRHAHGWTQPEVADAYNRQLDDDQAPMTSKRISDFEAWPHGGKKPLNALAMLAKIYSTEVANLVDLDDRRMLSAQELITLDAYKTTTTASKLPGVLPENRTRNPAAPGENATLSDSNISIVIGQTNQISEAIAPSQRHRCHLVLAWLLAVITAIGGAITTRIITTDPHTAPPMPMPARTSTPSPPAASGPSSTPPLSPSPPSQTVPPQQPLIPLSPQTMAAQAPRQPSIQTPPLSTRSVPLPPPPQSPTTKTASVSAATITWANMYSGLCLDEHEADGTGDTATLRLWPCNGSPNQMWIEQIIPAHPASLAKNLVSFRSRKCVTYQPGPGYRISVWLAPCGQDGQAWHRDLNDEAYFFHAVEIPGWACMSAPNGPAAEGLTGVQLQPCDPPSPLTDWRPYN